MLSRGLTAVALLLALAPVSARRKDESIPHGRVTLPDGSAPQLLVTVELVCKGAVRSTVFTGSDGGFTIDAGDTSGCEVQAYLPGYRSKSVPFAADSGTLVLTSRAKNEAILRSQRNKDFTSIKNAWKSYQKGLDQAAKAKWKDAEFSFQDATKVFAISGAAWLCLGMVQEQQGDPLHAKKSYREAIRVEPQFALPYVYAAALEIRRAEWQEAFNDSDRTLQFDLQAFPGVWLNYSWANLNLHKMDMAEKSAREGIKLDLEHRFPELEYVLGLIYVDKRDAAASKEHFQQYLALAPNGPRAAAARAELNK